MPTAGLSLDALGDEGYALSELAVGALEGRPPALQLPGGPALQAAPRYPGAVSAVPQLASVVAIMEPMVGALMQRLRLRRVSAAVAVGVLVWLLALVVTLSFAPGDEYTRLANGNLFRFMDKFTAELLLPIVALLTAVLVGWRLRPEILRLELYREMDLFFSLWQRLLRYIAPPAIALIIIAALLGLLA